MDPFDDWLARRAAPAGRPQVTLSYAQSLDGSIARRRGEPLALSGPESQKLTHRFRAAHDAILVGIGTVLSDDPQLNVRLVEGNDPQPVILDSQLRTPLNSKLLKKDNHPIVFCTAGAKWDAEDALVAAGARVERQAHATDRVDLSAMLARLHALGVRSLMVEGGGEVISSFLDGGLVDRIAITVAPITVNGYKPAKSLSQSSLDGFRVDKFGEDLVIWGDLVHA